MKWFGESWGGSICTPDNHIPTPEASICCWCNEKICQEDRGFSIPDLSETGKTFWHLECFMRDIFGSVGHQKQKCSCYGGDEDDPDGLTQREAAQAAFDYFRNNANERI